MSAFNVANIIPLIFAGLIINKGTIFCHVGTKKQFIRLLFYIVLGNQKWHGAAPTFRIIAIILINTVIFINERVLKIIEQPRDPQPCLNVQEIM